MSDPTSNHNLISALVRVESMADDISEMKGAMKEMAHALRTLALVEERQNADRVEMLRASKRLDDHDGRIKTLELAQPLQKQASDWVGKFVSMVIGAVITAVLALVVIGKPATTTTTSTRTTVETPQR